MTCHLVSVKSAYELMLIYCQSDTQEQIRYLVKDDDFISRKCIENIVCKTSAIIALAYVCQLPIAPALANMEVECCKYFNTVSQK